MGQKIVQSDREDVKTIQEDEKIVFIFSVLSQFISEEELNKVFPNEEGITPEQKIQLRRLCHKFKTRIVEEFDGPVEVFVNDKMIAKWEKPWVILKTNPLEPDRNKRLYAEIQFKWWLISEEQNET